MHIVHLETRIDLTYTRRYPHIAKLAYKDGHLVPKVLPIVKLQVIPPTHLNKLFDENLPYDILINEFFTFDEGDIIQVVGKWMAPPWNAETEKLGEKLPKDKKLKKGKQYIIEGYYNVLADKLLEIDKHQALDLCVWKKRSGRGSLHQYLNTSSQSQKKKQSQEVHNDEILGSTSQPRHG